MKLRGMARQIGVAFKFFVVATLALGVAYPVGIWALGLAVPDAGIVRASDGTAAANSLLVQTSAEVQAAPQWFHARPSAVDWQVSGSGASNLGPNEPKLQAQLAVTRQKIADVENVSPAKVPADAYTASASGLDPTISPEYAALQAPRVATANDLTLAVVQALISAHTNSSFEAALGQPAVNVTALNVALAQSVKGS